MLRLNSKKTSVTSSMYKRQKRLLKLRNEQKQKNVFELERNSKPLKNSK